MPDKNLTDVTDNKVGKMTDTEIKKALEICGTYKGKCTDCPAFIKVDRSNCKKVLLGALDIINRLQAKVDDKEDAIQYADKVIKSLQADMDRLQANISELVKQTKSEAYKEFAERLKEKYKPYVILLSRVAENEINNLLKELVGEDNA